MAYEVSWREEAMQELAHQFSKKDARAIVSKIEKIAVGLPRSVLLRTVVPVRGAVLSGNRSVYEVKIGSR